MRDSVLLAVKHAAMALGVTTERVRQLVKAGRMFAVRDSLGRYLFPASEVERMRRERERGDRSHTR